MTRRQDFGDVAAAVLGGGSIGILVGGLLGFVLLAIMFPLPANVPNNVWLLFWLGVALSTALGAVIGAVVVKSSELRDLRNYIDTFFSSADHQTCVDRFLKRLAIQAAEASARAIDLRTNGIKPEMSETEALDPGLVLAKCRKIQDDADRWFQINQAWFYNDFDLAAKVEEDFGLKLGERKFKAYASADQPAEEAKN